MSSQKSSRIKTEIGVMDTDTIDISSESENEEPAKKVPKKVSRKRTRIKSEAEDSDEDFSLAPKKTKKQNNNKERKSRPPKKVKTEDKLTDPDSVQNVKEERRCKVKKEETSESELKVEKEKYNTELESLMKAQSNKNEPLDMDWTEVQYLGEIHNLSEHVASNVVELFEQDNTVPFIARYRKNMTGGMEAEILRAMKESYDRAKIIKQKASSLIKSVDKLGKWTPSIHALIKSSKSLNSLEYISSLFKVPGKRSLSEKARELGLGGVSEKILTGQPIPSLNSFINSSKEGLKNEKEVKDGIIHILADIINKDKSLFDLIQELRKTTVAHIHVTQRKSIIKEAKEVKVEGKSVRKSETVDKYETYFDFKSKSDTIKPHQILAINRGENHKFLSVKFTLPNWFEDRLRQGFQKIFCKSIKSSTVHKNVMLDSFNYAYKKSIEPAFIRRVRNEMNEQAESASIEVFATNLKQLLLAPPFRGKPILGIDPGFFHGCKCAVISETGTVLSTDVIHLPETNKFKDNSAFKLASMLKENNCTVIALGNGTACRQTEVFLTDLIQSGAFKPLDVSYTIVDECGASIYSCSEEAKKEFPNVDCNLISAISIARRLQDPLAELVKVEPKHLGVGMYQHDLPEKQLDATLSEVVTEAVSFVGVDVNTASLCLLKRIAGLTLARAKGIIEWRSVNGAFTNRKQLMKVKGIGSKSFEQCAGFIRINPDTTAGLSKSCTMPFNFLDQTWIHPESYDIANQIIKNAKCNIQSLGTEQFVRSIEKYAAMGLDVLAANLNTEKATVDVVIKGLMAKKEDDVRLQGEEPLFRKSLKSFDDLEVGMDMTGKVRNVTHFGSFVDVGVNMNGLIPLKFMRNQTLKIGQRVNVKVKSVEKERKRLCFQLLDAY